MCGLAGFLAHGRHVRPAPERRAILAAMGRQLASRGPDDEQTYDDGVLSLVFRRLSIVDVAGGRQPLWNERRSAFVAMNGEIWNHAALRETLRGTHALATRSDAEVVIHLFEDEGPRLLDRLNGMFALAVWDREAERLLLARDRLGIKPLYYAWTPGGLLFGSELKALLVHPDCPAELRFHDLDLGYLGGAAYTGFSGAHVPSFVEGVDLLPGGTYLDAAPGRRPAPQAYWSLEPAIARATEAPPRPAAEYAEEYAALLVDAVRGQLMSDVPVGAFLSGGLDSSLLCAVAAKQGQALPCFSVVERTTVDAGDVARARRLTEALDLPFYPVSYDHEGFAEQIGFSLASLESFVWMMDAPRFTPELLFKHELHRYAKTVVPDLKAMLLGQGADEFAGGYSTPRGAPVADWDGYAARLSPSPPAQIVARGVPEAMRALVRPEALAVEGRAGAGAPFHGEMRRRLLTLQALNLWNEDRIAAVQGVEARVPYLDHRLVEHLAAIPPALHRELFWDKAIVRRAAAGFLPDDIVHAPKVPFWLSGDASSVHAIMVDCARRCFPAFLEAYLGQPDSLFSASALVALYARTRPRAPDRVESAKLLLACMTAAIFARLCRDLRRDALAIRPMGPPSPLGRASW
ncbi:asparagine synthase (glutamine-hydrolyzing) [Sorangium sp. So ce1182]|uniref:asparagine synthase (glutamine-hydrolyzing) n=1 Tax=Sorangium sp. So ce1182 TaxID=3133334 RepID=UPI003F5EC85F